MLIVYNRQSWRNSALISPCTNDTINTSELIGDGAYECKTNSCSQLSNRQKLVTAAVSCTDYDDQFDYATGVKYTTLYLPVLSRKANVDCIASFDSHNDETIMMFKRRSNFCMFSFSNVSQFVYKTSLNEK